MTLHDKELFAEQMLDVLPIKTPEKVVLKKASPDEPGIQYRREMASYSKQELPGLLSLILKKQLRVDDWLSYKRDGIQEGVFKHFRLGKYAFESSLNLSNKSPPKARDELMVFIQDCQELNIRCAIIHFGRGKYQGELLKSYLAQWLPELEQVQAFHTAQSHHGGSSAVYVLLRKSARERQKNSERFAARKGH